MELARRGCETFYISADIYITNYDSEKRIENIYIEIMCDYLVLSVLLIFKRTVEQYEFQSDLI